MDLCADHLCTFGSQHRCENPKESLSEGLFRVILLCLTQEDTSNEGMTLLTLTGGRKLCFYKNVETRS